MMLSLQQKDYRFILEVSLEKLHQQSLQWLSELNFWSIELNFLQNLLKVRSPEFINESKKKDKESFEGLIQNYQRYLVSPLKESVMKHEKELVKLITSSQVQDEVYRRHHHDLNQRLSAFDVEFKSLKMEIFELVESVQKENHENPEDLSPY